MWETDLSLRDNERGAAFADVWCAIPTVEVPQPKFYRWPGGSNVGR